jgi:hypothetical protein
MSLEQKIDHLIKDMGLLVGKVEQRAKVTEQNNTKAIQSMTQLGQSVSGATQDIQRITSHTLSNAMQKPIEDHNHDLKIMRDNLIRNANDVENHMQESVKKLKRIVWTAMGAFALAGVVVLGASTYAMMQATQKLKQADWVGNINTAVANGKLAVCADGGLCAVVNGKQVRLDK